MLALCLLRHVGQGGLHHGANAVAGHLHALAQTAAKALIHRLGQLGVAGFDIAVEAVLLRAQAVAQLLAVLLHAGHEGAQLLDHQRQSLGLLLQGFVGFLTLVRERESAQLLAHQTVQLVCSTGAFAARQAGHQPQHGRGGHASDRSAKSQAQAFDGL